ncbi:transcriptional regulator family: Fungal Specific TF [Paecilomyces variotii]|nr:transcriptional regulator family: Fungal Specific TF [Paecilomyces variotii]KAJ9209009.1 transcriptional regulator family: Fungal Specific TF [Paecilomyces variotii]KAJ9222689.1 transcriptional regulator family: Fungal Specific TF [Paecilomyces variotii]KAJ9247554.1 transcriptional regulator family: Fungal Specific TF [Paecilomyces variotii]KAJ9282889.1 transcriptional regulator family: Fungal Specific TF [Paecilomyces variotii]
MDAASSPRLPGRNSTLRACDQCKLRKTRCSLSRPCATCASMGFECTFLRPQKKRGPAGRRVSEIRQQQIQSRKHPVQTDVHHFTGERPSSHGTSATDAHSSPSASISNSEVISHVDTHHLQQHQMGQGPTSAYDAAAMSTPALDNGSTSWSENRDLEYWLPDSLSAQTPAFSFSGSNIYVKTTLPPLIDGDLGASAINLQPENPLNVSFSDVLSSNDQQQMGAFWPPYIHDNSLVPWIDVYFDRLHPTLPVLNRSSIFIRILSQEHRRNPQFGAMLLSVCAFALTQPIDISERPTSSSRADQARLMMNEATKMRSSSDFGEHPTLEAVLTSFFLFGYLFGSNQHNAARLRLREAIDLASTLRLNDPNTYLDFSGEEKGQWLRTYLVLSVTERAYALQRRHSISFTGRPGFTMRPTDDFIHNVTHSLVSGIIVHNEKDAAGMMGLALLMEIFDSIDEDIVECWNARCNASKGRCQILDQRKALSMHENLARVSDPSRYRSNDWFDPDHSSLLHSAETTRILQSFLSETQCADVLVTQKWVQNRIWHLCLTHGLLISDSEHPELRFDFAYSVAERTLDVCRSLRISAMEVHGIGIIEKLYNISTSAIMAPYNTGNMEGSASTSGPALQLLASKYMRLLQTLRGGNHPYMEQYKETAELVAPSSQG